MPVACRQQGLLSPSVSHAQLSGELLRENQELKEKVRATALGLQLLRIPQLTSVLRSLTRLQLQELEKRTEEYNAFVKVSVVQHMVLLLATPPSYPLPYVLPTTSSGSGRTRVPCTLPYRLWLGKSEQ